MAKKDPLTPAAVGVDDFAGVHLKGTNETGEKSKVMGYLRAIAKSPFGRCYETPNEINK